MSEVYAIDVAAAAAAAAVVVVPAVFTIKLFSKLLNRVRMLYKIQRVFACQCLCNRNAVDSKKNRRTLSGLQPEGIKKSTHAKRVKK